MKKLRARNPPLRNVPTKTPRAIIQVKTRDNAEWYKPQPSMLAKRYKIDWTLHPDSPASQLSDVSSLDLWNNGGIVCLISPGKVAYYPTSPSGLPAGSIWNDGLIVAVVPPTNPNPWATPIIWPNVSALGLLALSGKDLPITMPSIPGQLWNDGGWVAIVPPTILTVADFWNDGGILAFSIPGRANTYPPSPIGLSPGSVWNNGLTVGVVGPTSPNPTAPPIIWPNITAAQLLTTGGANLPISIPATSNQIWNDNGVVSIAPPYP